jgi:hypothetical protein
MLSSQRQLLETEEVGQGLLQGHKEGVRRKAEETMKEFLLQAIRDYLSSIKDKWFRNTGRERAGKLSDLIENELAGFENLDDMQLAARIISYVEKPRGQGPLDTSTDLRRALVDGICKFIFPDTYQTIVRQAKHSFEIQRNARIEAATYGARSIATPYVEILFNKQLDKVKGFFEQTQAKLEFNTEEYPYVAKLLADIKAYRKTCKSNCCWRIKLTKRKGYRRSGELRDHVLNDLIAKEGLTDYQVMCRMREYLSEPNGHGYLDTSKQLRASLIQGMHSSMGLDRRVVEGQVYSQIQGTLEYCVAARDGSAALAIDERDMYNQARLKHIHETLKDGYDNREELRVSLN